MSPSRNGREGDIDWCCSWRVYRESSSMSTAVTVTDSTREPKHPSLLLKKKNTRSWSFTGQGRDALSVVGIGQTELLWRVSSS
jgi:hypothetical protein